MKTRGFLGVGAAILLLSAGVSFAGEQVIQNGAMNGSVRVSVEDMGRMAAWRFGGNAWVKQTYGVNSKYSLLFLDGDNPAMIFGGGRTGSLWIPVSNTTNADNTAITTRFRTPDGGVRITQITTVTPGPYYRMQWNIENIGSATYNDVRFAHGEDTDLAGSDHGEGHFDNALKMVYVADVASGTADLMGIYASASTPFHCYFEGYYSENQARMNSWTMDNTADPTGVDGGYSLGWIRSSLAPGQTWTIIAYEKFTRAVGVQVNAPAEQTGSPGDTLTYAFTVRNLDAGSRNISLSPFSSNGFAASVVDGFGNPLPSVTLGGGTDALVYVRVTIPAGAAAETTDLLTLTAAYDEADTGSDSTGARVAGATAVPPSTSNLPSRGMGNDASGCSVVSGRNGDGKRSAPENAGLVLLNTAFLLGPVFLLRFLGGRNRRRA